MQVTMSEMDAFIHEVLDKEDLVYRHDEENHAFRLQMGIPGCKINGLTIVLRLLPDSSDSERCMKLQSVSTINIGADDSCMSEVGEFLHRANYGLLIGNFEMDYNDGEVRFTICVSTEDTFPGFEMVRDLVGLPPAMFRRYGNGLLSVIMGAASPAKAIMTIEGHDDDDDGEE